MTTVWHPREPVRVRPEGITWQRQGTGRYWGRVAMVGPVRFSARKDGRSQWNLYDREAKRGRRHTTLRTYTDCRGEARKRLRDEAEEQARREAMERGVGPVGSEYVLALECRIEELEQTVVALADRVNTLEAK
jgi:hypothetical protein